MSKVIGDRVTQIEIMSGAGHIPLIPALGKLTDLSKFEANLIYIASSRYHETMPQTNIQTKTIGSYHSQE